MQGMTWIYCRLHQKLSLRHLHILLLSQPVVVTSNLPSLEFATFVTRKAMPSPSHNESKESVVAKHIISSLVSTTLSC